MEDAEEVEVVVVEVAAEEGLEEVEGEPVEEEEGEDEHITNIL